MGDPGLVSPLTVEAKNVTRHKPMQSKIFLNFGLIFRFFLFKNKNVFLYCFLMKYVKVSSCDGLRAYENALVESPWQAVARIVLVPQLHRFPGYDYKY